MTITNSINHTQGNVVYPTSATQGDILYASATNTISDLAKDTNATRYLSNTGTSNAPAWAQVNAANGVTGVLPAANGGSWVLIQSQTASNSASLTFTTGITSTYPNLMIVWNKVLPQNNSTDLQCLISIDSGATYKATGYLSGCTVFTYNSATAVGNVNATTFAYMSFGLGTTNSISSSGIFYIMDATTGEFPKFLGHSSVVNNSVPEYQWLIGDQSFTTINALKIQMSSGNLVTGTFSLYGLQVA